MLQKQKFSFRKYGKILAPALIGVTGLIAVNNTARAGEIEEIKSPIIYIANENLEVGKQQEIVKGKTGKLEFSTNANGDPVAKEIEKRKETKIEVGVKPTVEEKIDPHKTTYHLDETKDFGDNKEIKGQDGVKSTTTTYKIKEEINSNLLVPNDKQNELNLKHSEIDLSSFNSRQDYITSLNILYYYKWIFTMRNKSAYSTIKNHTNIDEKPTAEEHRLLYYNATHITPETLEAFNKDYEFIKKMVKDLEEKYGPLEGPTNGSSNHTSEKEIVRNFDILNQNFLRMANKNDEQSQLPKINYKENIPQEIRDEFEKKLKELPKELFRQLPSISFEEQWAAGFANLQVQHILLKYEENNTADYIYYIFLHELGHIIDGKSGDTKNRYSNSKEFLELYDKYIKNDNSLDLYFKTDEKEAFAEAFGQYLNKKIYKVEYTEKVFSKVEPYFDRLYNQLFEQPRVAKVVVDKVIEKNQERKDGKVVYGAKPTEKTTPLKHEVKYQADETKDFGFEETKVSGKDGVKVVRTSYILENNRPKAVETTLKDEKAVNSVVIKGTKPKIENPKTEIEGNLQVTKTKTTSYSLNENTGKVTPSEQLSQTAKLNENLTLKELPVLDLSLFTTTKPKVETAKGTGLRQETKPEIVIESKKGTSVTAEEKPKLEESLLTTTKPKVETAKGTGLRQETKPEIVIESRKGASVTAELPRELGITAKGLQNLVETKPELHIIPTKDGSIKAKIEVLVQEEKLALNPKLLVTKIDKVFTKASDKTVGKSSSKVLPKTSVATETNSALPAGLAVALAGAGLLSLRKRKED